MTALHAAGGGLPLAVHLPHIVEQIGSLAGFAAVAGLAVLSALYFSQARDLKRLREWAGRAPERAAEMAGACIGSGSSGRRRGKRRSRGPIRTGGRAERRARIRAWRRTGIRAGGRAARTGPRRRGPPAPADIGPAAAHGQRSARSPR